MMFILQYNKIMGSNFRECNIFMLYIKITNWFEFANFVNTTRLL